MIGYREGGKADFMEDMDKRTEPLGLAPAGLQRSCSNHPQLLRHSCELRLYDELQGLLEMAEEDSMSTLCYPMYDSHD